jgi:hypothetical protein
MLTLPVMLAKLLVLSLGGQCLRVKPGSSLCFKQIACIPVVVHIQHFSRVRQRLYPVCAPGLGVIALMLCSLAMATDEAYGRPVD